MTVLSSFLRQLIKLWLAPDLALVGQLRERRMRLLASAVLVVVAGFWGVFFGLRGLWGVVLVGLSMISCGIAVFVLTWRNKVRSANLLLFSVIIVVVVGMTLLLDPYSAEAPRATHLYLLPIAVAALMAFREEPTWLRYGVALLCLALFIALASSTWTPTRAYSLPDEVRLVGSWVQGIASMGMLMVLLHILQSDASERSVLDRDLQVALREQQFELHYQAQLDNTGRVVGAEVLIRWRHPQRGLLPPVEFIGHAETTGLIIPIGQWVLAQSIKQLHVWQKNPLFADLGLAVNISQKQFRQSTFVGETVRLIDEQGIAAQRLELELTETLIVQDVDDQLRKMNELVARGVRFSLDDFGTGFSSLSHLKRLPLNTLKIDRSFISDVLTDNSSQSIVRTVIALSHSLGMSNIVLFRLIKQCRTEAGLTQGQFAQALERPQSFASDIEQGSRRLDLVQLRDICKVLGIGLVEFVQRYEAELSLEEAGKKLRIFTQAASGGFLLRADSSRAVGGAMTGLSKW